MSQQNINEPPKGHGRRLLDRTTTTRLTEPVRVLAGARVEEEIASGNSKRTRSVGNALLAILKRYGHCFFAAFSIQ